MSVFKRDEQKSDPGHVETARRVGGRDETATTAAPAAASPAAPASGHKAGQRSLIYPGLTITGNLDSEGEIEVGGTIEGDIRTGTLIVNESATIRGSVHADTVQVAGTIEGKIEAKQVSLSASAKVTGDVIHQRLEVEAGAYLDGHCRPGYGESKPQAGPAARPAQATASAGDGGQKPAQTQKAGSA